MGEKTEAASGAQAPTSAETGKQRQFSPLSRIFVWERGEQEGSLRVVGAIDGAAGPIYLI